MLALDGGRFGDIEAFALRNALGDIEHGHVAQFFQADQMSQGAADIACADEADFYTRHGLCPVSKC